MTARPVQVRLRLTYVDFWSATRLAFLIGTGVAIMTVLAFTTGYLLLQLAPTALEDLDKLSSGLSDGKFIPSRDVRLPQVLAFAAVAAILNLIAMSVLGAISAGIYNTAVSIAKGLPVGFSPHV